MSCTTSSGSAATAGQANTTRLSPGRSLDERRALIVRIAGDERLIAAEDAGRYRDGLGVMPPGGLPEVFLEGGADSLRQIVLRYAKGRGPFTTPEVSERYGRDLGSLLAELEREELLVRGELRPGGTEREWCDPDVLRRLRRASLAALRREVEPVEPAALARFLPSWHGIDRKASLREALVPLQALAVPVALWETELLPRRVPHYRPEQLDSLCASGEVVWVGAGLDRVALYFREDAAALGQVAGAARPEGEVHDRLRAAFAGGALFWLDLLEETVASAGRGSAGARGTSSGPARSRTTPGPRYAPAAATACRSPSGDRGGSRAPAAPAPRRPRGAGRSPTGSSQARPSGGLSPSCCSSARASSPATASEPRAFRAATAPSTRSCGRSRHSALPPRVLRRGARRRAVRARRRSRAAPRAPRAGGGAAAVRDRRRRSGPALRRGAPWPKRAGARAARVAGAQVVLIGGEAVLYVERGGRSLVPLREPDESWLRPAFDALVAHVRSGGGKRLAVERFDGSPVTESEVMPLLVEAGFLAGPRRAVLRP